MFDGFLICFESFESYISHQKHHVTCVCDCFEFVCSLYTYKQDVVSTVTAPVFVCCPCPDPNDIADEIKREWCRIVVGPWISGSYA